MANLWDSFIDGYNNPPGMAPEESDSGKGTAWDRLIAGTPSGQRSPGDPGARQVMTYDWAVEGLVKRGMPQHVAEGFAMNFQDESGFDTGVNEADPTVEGSRGGFGLYQTTGPRRVQQETFAKQRGVDAADPEMSLDFLIWELENTEKSARNAIYATNTAGEAGAAVVNKFLRPAEEHRERRASKYRGGPVRPTSRPTQTKLWLDF